MKAEWRPAGAITRVPAHGIYHAPVRSTRELAKEFGTTSHSLAALLRADPSAPQPKYSSTAGTFFNYAKVKRWWAKLQAAKVGA